MKTSPTPKPPKRLVFRGSQSPEKSVRITVTVDVNPEVFDVYTGSDSVTVSLVGKHIDKHGFLDVLKILRDHSVTRDVRRITVAMAPQRK